MELGRRVFGAAPVIILHLDLDGTIRDVSPYFERLTGHRADELRGRDWFDACLPARDRDELRALFGRICEVQRLHDHVNPLVTRAGDELEIAWTNDILRDDAGRPIGVLAIGHDVTARVRAERATQALEQRLRSILDGMAAFVGVFDLAGNVLEANRPALEAAGLRREDALGRPFVALYWFAHSEEEQRKALAAHARACRGEVVRVELRVRVGDDRLADFEAVFGPLRDAGGAIEAVIGSGVDITERKAAERAARRADALLRAVIDGVPAIIFAVDRDGVFTLSEGRGLAALGLRPGEIVGRTPRDVFGPDPDLEAAFHHALTGEQTLRSKRRGALEFEMVFGPSRGADGRIDGVLGVALDVTERRAAEEALAESEERLRLALDASGLGMWEVDPRALLVTLCSASAPAAAPTDPDDAHGPLARVHPDDRERAWSAFHAYVAGERPKFEAELRVRGETDAWRWILVTGTIVERDAAGQPARMIGTHLDIDARKLAELETAAALREKETLLREVHHRVKNNLQIVSALLHFQTKKTSSPDVRAACADVQRRLLAMNLVHERLYRSSSLALVDFGDYVRSLVGALALSFEGRGALRIDLPERRIELPSETVLPAGMILCELVTNVFKYAWPGPPGRARVGLSSESGCVVLAVEDDGVGLPPGVDPRTTDSFGWQLVRTLVAQLDGRLEVASDRGTRTRVLFRPPRTPDPSGATPP